MNLQTGSYLMSYLMTKICSIWGNINSSPSDESFWSCFISLRIGFCGLQKCLENFCFTYIYVYILYMCVFVGLSCKMYFLDQKSLQATVVKLYWQIKAQINLKKMFREFYDRFLFHTRPATDCFKLTSCDRDLCG